MYVLLDSQEKDTCRAAQCVHSLVFFVVGFVVCPARSTAREESNNEYRYDDYDISKVSCILFFQFGNGMFPSITTTKSHRVTPLVVGYKYIHASLIPSRERTTDKIQTCM